MFIARHDFGEDALNKKSPLDPEYRPLRHFVRRSDLVAFKGEADRARTSQIDRY